MGPDVMNIAGGEGDAGGAASAASDVTPVADTGGSVETTEASSSSSSPADAAPDAAPTAPVETAAAPQEKADAKEYKPDPSLLSEAGKEGEEKPADAAAEEVPADAPAVELPTYDAFTLPEGLEIKDPEQMKAFTNILGEFELQGKIPHELMQEMGQKLTDLWADVSKKMQSEAAQAQYDVWSATRAGFVEEIKADPILGRNRFETSLRDAVLVRDMFATEKTRQMMDFTGAGDHIGMMQLFCNVAKSLRKHGLLEEGTPVQSPPQKGLSPNGNGGPRNRYNASTKGA